MQAKFSLLPSDMTYVHLAGIGSGRIDLSNREPAVYIQVELQASHPHPRSGKSISTARCNENQANRVSRGRDASQEPRRRSNASEDDQAPIELSDRFVVGDEEYACVPSLSWILALTLSMASGRSHRHLRSWSRRRRRAAASERERARPRANGGIRPRRLD